MGKAGNTRRKAKAKGKAVEKDIMAEIDAEARANVHNLLTADAAEALEKIYGKKGVPKDDPVFSFLMSKPPVDMLGNKIDYNKGNVLLAGAPANQNTLPKVVTPKELLQQKREAAKAMREAAEDDKKIIHSVTLLRDHLLDYPELWIKVYVSGPKIARKGFAAMFARARCTKADTPEEADLVVFTGGEDVDPAYYGEKPHNQSWFDEKRDEEECMLYVKCLNEGIPMLGICRGAQFLHVMNGGKLWQHVDGHHGAHSMWDIRTQQRLDNVSSVHHQMCMPNSSGGMEIIGVSGGKSAKRYFNDSSFETGSNNDIEAFFYRDTVCIGIQGHPEYSGFNRFTQWCLKLIENLVIINEDIDWIPFDGGDKNKHVRRLKPELIAERDGFAVLEGKPTSPNVKTPTGASIITQIPPYINGDK